MNRCVKTGFTFLDMDAGGLVRTGDLFYISGLFQIRGIPPGVFDRHIQIDSGVSNCVLAQRANSTYMDSNLGIKLVAPTDEFIKYIKEWYPQLSKALP